MRLGVFMPFLLLFSVSALTDNHKTSAVMVEIEANNVYERSKIANLIHIDSVLENRVYAMVNNDDFAALRRHADIKILSAEVFKDEESVKGYFDPLRAVVDFPDRDQAFHTYDEMLKALRDLEAAHEGLAEVFSIGKTIENRDIWAIRISDDSGEVTDKKGIAYMGTHHAREHLSTEIPLLFAKELLDHSQDQPEIKDLLKKIEIFIIPMVNPDGAMHDIENKNYKWWRKNRRANRDGSFGVDLNRNYGFGWGTGGSSTTPSSDIYMGTEAFSEPETQRIRDFFKEHHNITIALSLHTFSELVLYPWGGREEGVGGQEELLFKTMAETMAEMNHYTPMQSSELYIASGDTCDWLYGELKVLCFTFELSPSSMFEGGFYPGAPIIAQVFDDNLEPMLYLANLAENPRKVFEIKP